MTFNDIKAVSFSKEPPVVKSPTIWAHTDDGLESLCYLRKPKHISDDVWEQFLEGFDFSVKYPPFVARMGAER